MRPTILPAKENDKVFEKEQEIFDRYFKTFLKNQQQFEEEENGK